MKSKLFLTVLLLAAITTVGISQEKKFRLGQWWGATYVRSLSEEKRVFGLSLKEASLCDVEAIYLRVAGLPGEAREAGLTKKLLITDLEQKFRAAGIEVYTEGAHHALGGGPSLWIDVDVSRDLDIGSPTPPIRDNSITYCISLEFEQWVYVVRKFPIVTDGITWKDRTISRHDKSDFKKYARSNVKSMVDEFINDYLTANPKK